MPKKSVKAELVEDRVVIWDKSDANKIFESGWYGNFEEGKLELALLEAALLLERKKIEVTIKKKKLTFKNFYKLALKIDPRFNIRYIVYKDLRERGFPTRTGFKFGCDFRVYGRGVKPLKRGPKAPHEHTKWIVFAVPEDYSCSFHELSRAVRLAHNIRSNMLWAVVDNDNDVTYYEVEYISP